ncbi:MAG TPA: protein phosphatase 2C domain-containing protein [Pseudomonadales bacterium]|jgi:protein phosphatase
MTPLKYGAATDVGLIRDNNEDAFLARPDIGLWVVADGMGGHEAGEEASRITKEYIERAILNGSSLRLAIAESHHEVMRQAVLHPEKAGMGTTVVALRTHGLEYEIEWVGDSRAYLWTGTDLYRMSRDHSLVQSMVDSGVLTEAEAVNHPQKNVIVQSIGVATLADVKVDQISGVWEPGHRILLCSDGLTDLVSEQTIADILSQEGDEQTLVNRLLQAALDRGGNDNVTVQVISAPESISQLGKIQRVLLNSPLAPLVHHFKDRQRALILGSVLLAVACAILIFR